MKLKVQIAVFNITAGVICSFCAAISAKRSQATPTQFAVPKPRPPQIMIAPRNSSALYDPDSADVNVTNSSCKPKSKKITNMKIQIMIDEDAFTIPAPSVPGSLVQWISMK
ncbi:MAG: hypothetical protein VB050_15460 [Geobacteraceae bacterium]|nr:hypothetical protein [Geobacteraceae bacterium]